MRNPIHTMLIHTVQLGDRVVKGKDQDRILDAYAVLRDPDKMMRDNMHTMVLIYETTVLYRPEDVLN